jgi:heavy metal sensor kinase
VNARSLKFRLVVWHAGWLVVLSILFAIFSYVTLRFYLEQNMRETLSRRARQISALVERSQLSGDALELEIRSRFMPEANNRFTRITMDSSVSFVSGPPVDGSFNPATVPPTESRLVDKEKGPRDKFERRKLPDGHILFVLSQFRKVRNQSVVIEEGASAAPIDTALHERLLLLLAGLAFLSVVTALGGALLVQRALAPVDHIIKSAEQISSRNLSERLPLSGAGDELDRLSTSLNGMIRRLDEAFEQTRRFMADASHELRTPLTILNGELESLVEQNSGKPEVCEIADSALEEVGRLKKTVEALFALSRLDAGEAQQESVPVNLGELVATTTDQMFLLAEDKNISIDCRCPKQVMVQGDRSRLKQVVVNLLDNAIKYTPAGGRIDVSVSARDHHAVFEVADNGIGIPSTALPHVFDRFFRTDDARSRELGGAGLGLAIVKSICLAHNGRVEVQSKEGEGSQFTVELPLITASQPFIGARTS